MKIVALLLLMVSATRAAPSPCICPAVYDPVCASKDGADREYSNDCQADCDGATNIRTGACLSVNPLNEDNCLCPTLYDPVCGADRKTYSSRCLAACAGITRFIGGSCEQPIHHNNEVVHYNLNGGNCVCPSIQDVVCGGDRRTYASPCLATCNGVSRTIPGPCNLLQHHKRSNEVQHYAGANQNCACPRIKEIVCGADGNTYNSPCEATCAGVTRTQPGPCFQVSHHGAGARRDCSCPRILDPVCGGDGNEYNSPCEATCNGVTRVRPGSCFQVTHHVSSGCICPSIYAPVCGSDGRTYVSACLAGCRNVPEVTFGPCNQVQHHKG